MLIFLVNAAQHPGPAIFQGVSLIVVAIWAIWLFRRPIDLHPKPDRFQRAYERHQAARIKPETLEAVTQDFSARPSIYGNTVSRPRYGVWITVDD